MSKRSGPTIGSASRPMVSSAGADHVIFSKKLLVSLAVVMGLTAFLFFTIEQSRIAGNMAKSRAALKQTNNIKDANLKLQSSKAELEDEEAELVNLYSKWLDEDSSELELSQEQLAELKAQLKDVTEKIKANSETLGSKDLTLVEKEKRLTAYQFKIQQKQNFIESMAAMIKKHTGQAPKGAAIDETVDDLVWDDELEGDDDFYEATNYEGDDDWLNDEEW
eukprot:m.35397 g.35397  ORF g.35397 m.35397 type:complete len:221 (-) comp12390_c0_seq1:77-739(-)